MRKLYSDEPIGICQCLMPEFKTRLINMFNRELEADEKDLKYTYEHKEGFLKTGWSDRIENRIKKLQEIIEEIKAIPNCDYEIKI